MHVISKLPSTGISIFTVMSELAAKHGAVNLGQGFPDFQMPQDLVELVADAMRNGYNQYTHLNGYLPLREAIAGKVAALYGTQVSPNSDIIVTPGGTYAIYTALTTILQRGDEVIVFGENPSAQELADALQTIPYEVFTNISERVKRVYWQE